MRVVKAWLTYLYPFPSGWLVLVTYHKRLPRYRARFLSSPYSREVILGTNSFLHSCQDQEHWGHVGAEAPRVEKEEKEGQ